MTLKNKENTENGKTITCRWEDLTGGNIPVEMGNCDVMIIENIPDHTSMTSLKKFLTLLPARQITAKTISGKIFTIELTKKHIEDHPSLQPFRQALKEIDRSIADLLEKRKEMISKIGEIKCEQAIPIIQPTYFEQKLKTLRISDDYTRSVFEEIHRCSIKEQIKNAVKILKLIP